MLKNGKNHTETVVECFTDTVRMDENGRHIVKLSWKEEHLPLSSNYGLARKRWDNLVKKSHHIKLENRRNLGLVRVGSSKGSTEPRFIGN